MKILCVYLLTIVCLVSACSKKDPLQRSVTGRVYVANTNLPVIGGFVNLSAHVYKNGVYNANVSQLASERTGLNGNYTMNFEKSNTEEYVLEVSGPGIFTTTDTLTQDEMYVGNPHQHDVAVYQSGTVQINLKNVASMPKPEDKITYGYFGPALPCNCCSKTPVVVTGPADTTFSCNVYANQYYVYTYSVYRPGTTLTFVKDSVLCNAGKTTTITINY